MKILTARNPMKPLTLALASMVAGVIMGALLLAPVSTFADHPTSDDPASEPLAVTRTFTIVDNTGVAAEFVLLENGGHLHLTLTEEAVYPDNDDDD